MDVQKPIVEAISRKTEQFTIKSLTFNSEELFKFDLRQYIFYV